MDVMIPARGVELPADVVLPAGTGAAVVFVHGSGSSRHSPRNRYVAGALQAAGLATVLVDLLTPAEEREDERTHALRFDIHMLAERTAAIVDGLVDWLATIPPTTTPATGPDTSPDVALQSGPHASRRAGVNIGLFGASTGAAAALVAAAQRPEAVGAVVSRGGRPDLAGEHLPGVRQPTLLIVGGRDTEVLRLNRQAMTRLAGETRLEIVPGASHLFPEPGALEQVAQLAADWFVTHLAPAAPDR